MSVKIKVVTTVRKIQMPFCCRSYLHGFLVISQMKRTVGNPQVCFFIGLTVVPIELQKLDVVREEIDSQILTTENKKIKYPTHF